MKNETQIDDGGAAFPLPKEIQIGLQAGSYGVLYGQFGLSVRDVFAAAALNGICSNLHCTPQVTYKEVAIRAYEQADAMLQARKEQG